MNNEGFIPLISKEVFDKEIEMCRQLNKKNSGKCNWGVCSQCGVLPILMKLYEGKILEDSAEINKMKNIIFNNCN